MTRETSSEAGLMRHVLAKLRGWPAARRYWVACSGGADSIALLDLMKRLEPELPGSIAVVHVNHGMHEDAAAWQAHVEQLARVLVVPCTVHRVRVERDRGHGPEGAARQARYAALARTVGAGELVVTAHHRDDQVETVLLRLLRGAGPAGLGGMSELVRFEGGWLGRPCLELARVELERHCRGHRRTWIEDPSNADVTRPRNRIRHEVLPVLERGWPATARVLTRFARLQGEAGELLARLGEIDLGAVLVEPGHAVQIDGLREMGRVRAANALRVWLGRAGLPLPSQVQLDGLLDVAFTARTDASVEHRWPGAVVRRYRGALYAQVPGAAPPLPDRLQWDLSGQLTLPSGVLCAVERCGAGLARAKLAGMRVEVRPRAGGERCRPAGRGVTKTVKSILREAGIPPWERERLPLVYVGEALAAVPGVCYCEPYAAATGERGVVLEWHGG